MAKQQNPLKQGMPAELRAAPAPPAFKDTLPSGLEVEWRMPDPFAIVAFDGVIPDPITAATIALLKDEKSYTPESDPKHFRQDAQAIIGMYKLAGAMLETPKLDPTREYGDGNGTLGRREIGYMDVCSLYWQFRTHTRQTPVRPANPVEPEQPAHAASDRGDVPSDASGADGD